MKNINAVDKVNQCIHRLEFLSDCFCGFAEGNVELSPQGSDGFIFILRDIIDNLEKASKMEREAKKKPVKEDQPTS